MKPLGKKPVGWQRELCGFLAGPGSLAFPSRTATVKGLGFGVWGFGAYRGLPKQTEEFSNAFFPTAATCEYTTMRPKSPTLSLKAFTYIEFLGNPFQESLQGPFF